MRALALAGVALLVLGRAAPVAAADTAAAAKAPEVTIDFGVLNSLGSSGPPPRHRLKLHPPGADHRDKAKTTTPVEAVKKPAAGPPGADRASLDADAKAQADTKAQADRERRETERKQAQAERERKATERKEAEAARKQAASERKEAEAARKRAAQAQVARDRAAESEMSRKRAADARAQPRVVESAPVKAAPPAAPPPNPGQVAAATPPAAPPQRVKPPPAKPAALKKPQGVLSGAIAPLHVEFAAGAADLSPPAKNELDAIAKSLAADDERRVQLVAYASGGSDEANQARRLSLSRALNVRAYLIDHGVRNTRMDVRALGNRPDGGKAVDRVDILFVEK